MTDDTRSPPANDNGAPKAKPCPICGRPASQTDAPFCSTRCADVDLHRWLGGVYRVPAAPSDDTEDSMPDGP